MRLRLKNNKPKNCSPYALADAITSNGTATSERFNLCR